MAILIRKQLTIADHHEAWLKRKVAETGESEASWVRRALDEMMGRDGFNRAVAGDFAKKAAMR